MTNYSEVGSTQGTVRRAGGSMAESSEPKLEQQMDLTQAMSLCRLDVHVWGCRAKHVLA